MAEALFAVWESKTMHTVKSPGNMPERKKEENILKAKMKLKRLLSFLLALLMVVGMLPATSMVAHAATTFDVTFTNGGNTTFIGEATVIENTSYECTIVPDTGYTLAKENMTVKCDYVDLNSEDWTYDAETGKLVIAASAVTDSITIYAKAVDARVDVEFSNGGNTTFTGEAKVIKGTAYECTIVPDTGYTLAKYNITVKCNHVDLNSEDWTYDAESGKLVIAAGAVTGYITIYAKAVDARVDVEFSNGGNTTFTGEAKVIKGTAYECTIVPDTGYTLAKYNITVKCNHVDLNSEDWTYDAESGKLVIAAGAVTGYITIYAKAVEKSATDITYTVSFNANGGTGTMDDVTGVYGSYTLPKNGFTAPAGKAFMGWSKSATGTIISTTTIDVTSDITLYAIWGNPLINMVDVKIDEPVAGAYPKDAVSNTDHVSVDVTEWWHNGTELSSTDTFEAGETYKAKVVVVPDSGYDFGKNPTVTFNGSTKGTISSQAKIIIYEADFTAVNATIIDSVDVTITEPVAGAHPQDAVSNTSNVSVSETNWYHNGKYLSASDTFEAGETYEVSVLVEPDNKYAFADDPTVTFNGSTTGTIEMNDNELIYYSAEFTAASGYAITVTDGKATDDAGNEITKAAVGTTVTLTANVDGKVFDKWVVESGSITLADARSATTTFTMPAGAVSVKATYKTVLGYISYVQIAIPEPVEGAHPESAWSYTNHLKIYSTVWRHKDGEPLSASDTFEAGETYTAVVSVILDGGVFFADNPVIDVNTTKAVTISDKQSDRLEFYAEYTVPCYQIEEIPDQTYTGKDVKPAVKVYDKGVLLKAGTDYTLTYVNNKNANAIGADGSRMMKFGDGVYDSMSDADFNPYLPYVIIKGKGNYQDEVFVNFNILPPVIGDGSAKEAEDVVLKYIDHTEANGKLFKPLTSIKCGKLTMKSGVDYEVKVAKAGEPETNLLDAKGQMAAVEGTYLMTIKGIGNFDGEIVKTIHVAAKPQLLKNAKIKLNIKSKEFDYSDPESDHTTLADGDYTVTITEGKTTKELVKDTDFTVSYRNNDKVGTATLVLTGKGTYVGSKTITFKITGTALSTKNVEISNVSDVTYTGKAIEQDAKLVLNKADGTKVDLVSGKDYTITYQNNLKKGTATMTFKGNGNAGYTGSVKKTFKINAANMTDVTADSIGSVSYAKAGATADEKVVLTYNGIKLVKGKDYTLKYTDNKDLGEACVTITGKGNFAGSLTKTFTIVQQDIANTAITVKPLAYNSKDSYVYKLTVTVKDGKSTLKNGVDYAVEFISPSKADLDLWLAGDTTKAPKATIKAVAGSCYKGSVEVPVSIYNVKLSGNNTYVKVDDSTNIYNGAQQLPKTVVYYSADKAVIKELNAAEKAGTIDTVIAEKLATGKIKVLTAKTDYTVSGGKNIFAGINKGIVKISGTGIYSGSVSKKFTIQKKDIWWK